MNTLTLDRVKELGKKWTSLKVARIMAGEVFTCIHKSHNSLTNCVQKWKDLYAMCKDVILLFMNLLVFPQ
jgi:hypothetical protein